MLVTLWGAVQASIVVPVKCRPLTRHTLNREAMSRFFWSQRDVTLALSKRLEDKVRNHSTFSKTPRIPLVCRDETSTGFLELHLEEMMIGPVDPLCKVKFNETSFDVLVNNK